MKLKTGTIPKDIKIFERPEKEITFRWDDIAVEDFQKVTKCIPIFVTDATNEKTQKTAKSWAEYPEYIWDSQTRKQTCIEHVPVISERPNDPIGGIRLIGLEHRSQGGRAYKALVLNKYVFDFREDVLLDAILNCGILENGVLPGEYVFASVGSEMKLIRVGSLLHEKMIEATDYWKKDVIGKLEVGGIYRNKVKTMLYLGPVYSRHVDVEWKTKTNAYASWGHANQMYADTKSPPKCARLAKEDRSHLFVDITDDKQKQNPQTIDDIAYLSAYRFTYYDKLPKSFREKIGHISGDIEELIQAVKERAIKGDDRGIENLIYYARTLNVSSKPGFLHPKIAAILTQ
jgi:hypothetical protein